MPMPKPDCPRLGTGIASAENRRLRRLLRIFVAIVCTNLVGLASALAEDAPLTPIPSIDLSLTNQLITVQALITNIREPTGPRSPYIVTLTESNATVPLVYWSDMQPQLSSKVKLGNIINAEVKVSTYRHNIQLRISSNDAIRVVGTAPIPAASTNTPAAGASPARSIYQRRANKARGFDKHDGCWCFCVRSIRQRRSDNQLPTRTRGNRHRENQGGLGRSRGGHFRHHFRRRHHRQRSSVQPSGRDR